MDRRTPSPSGTNSIPMSATSSSRTLRLLNLLEVIEASAELVSLQKVSTNAFHLYSKGKPLPSSESIRRIKDLPREGLLPIFRTLLGPNELAALAFSERLKAFRPKQTILEAEGEAAKAKNAQTRVDIAKDSIYVNGNRLSKKLPPKLYFALNKPKSYICSSADDSKSVISLFDDFFKKWIKSNPGIPKPRLFTVGRLDVATTGLIIVTNDGDFAQKISHPSSELTKEYIATIEGKVNRRHLVALSEGAQVEGVHCVPDSVELLSAQPNASRSQIRLVVHEGRNHEVRELVRNAGLQLYSLKRVRIGGFKLPSDLGLGKYVELKQSDFKLFEVKK